MARRRAEVARLAVGRNLPEEEKSFIQWENFPEPLITTSHFVGPNSARIQGRDSASSGQWDLFSPSNPY